MVLSAVATGTGVVGMYLIRRAGNALHRAGRTVNILMTRLPENLDITALGLTARELVVVAQIARERISDREIAEATSMSPATAGTHVRNIL